MHASNVGVATLPCEY